MKGWKVILAAAVIFGAGIGTGAMAARRIPQRTHINPPTPGPMGINRRADYVQKLNKNLDLTPQQRGEIEKIFNDSQVRIKKLWDPIAPKIREETRRTRRDIIKILSPEQRKKFDEMRARAPRSEEIKNREGQRSPRDKNFRSNDKLTNNVVFRPQEDNASEKTNQNR